MKFYIRTYDKTDKEDVKTSEKEIESINEALVQVKAGEKIHICRHEEGLPCSLV